MLGLSKHDSKHGTPNHASTSQHDIWSSVTLRSCKKGFIESKTNFQKSVLKTANQRGGATYFGN